MTRFSPKRRPQGRDSRRYLPLPLVLLIVAGQLAAGCGSADSTDDGSAPAPAPTTQVISFGLSPDRPPLRSSKEPWEPSGITTVTVHAGDRIEVRPKKLIHEERASLDPVTTRTPPEKVCTKNIQVCTATTPTFEQRCTQKCKMCQNCNWLGCRPDICCSNDCQNVHTGDQCTSTETRCAVEEVHWQDESVYAGLGDTAPKEDKSPMKAIAQITQGIRLKLDPVDFGTTTPSAECALKEFNPTVSADAISFTLANVPACPGLFPGADPGAGRTLTLINQMSTTASYQEGRLVKAQDGSVSERPKTQTYDVPIDFAGSFSIIPAGGR